MSNLNEGDERFGEVEMRENNNDAVYDYSLNNDDDLVSLLLFSRLQCVSFALGTSHLHHRTVTRLHAPLRWFES